jgi:hypothetical protein
MEALEKQWAVVEDGKLIRTFGRDLGSRDQARSEARLRRVYYCTGAKAVLLSRDAIDRLILLSRDAIDRLN